MILVVRRDGYTYFRGQDKVAKAVLGEVIRNLKLAIREQIQDTEDQKKAWPRKRWILGGWNVPAGSHDFVYEGCNHHPDHPQPMKRIVKSGPLAGMELVDV